MGHIINNEFSVSILPTKTVGDLQLAVKQHPQNRQALQMLEPHDPSSIRGQPNGEPNCSWPPFHDHNLSRPQVEQLQRQRLFLFVRDGSVLAQREGTMTD